MRTFLAFSMICLVGAGAAAQTPDRAAAPTDAALLATGWNAVATGQHAAAARSAAQVLARSPWNHAALSLQIEALAQTDGMKALDAYEAWLGQRSVEDAPLLEPVPRMIVLGAA